MRKTMNKKSIAMIALCFVAFFAAALGIHYWDRVPYVAAYEYDFKKPEVGDGTEENPYIINSEEEFYYITQDLDAYYKLNADLAFNDYIPICTTDYLAADKAIEKEEREAAKLYAFQGNFDGQNHRITYTVNNEFYNRTNSGYIGLFGEIYGDATIQNLIVEAHIGSEDGFRKGTYVGGLVGMAHSWFKGSSGGGCRSAAAAAASDPEYHSATISNVVIAEESFIKGDSSVGGLVGAKRGGTVENCKVYGTVYGNSGVGGITGYHYPIGNSKVTISDRTIIKDTVNYAEVTGNHMVGGIVGNSGTDMDSYITDSFNQGTSQFAIESTTGASSNYEYWGDVYGYQAKTTLGGQRIFMQNSGSRTTLNIKGDFKEIVGFQAKSETTFEIDGQTVEAPSGTGETTVVATSPFDGDLGTSEAYYGFISNYGGAYFRITRADGKYVYVSALDRTTAAFRHTIDVDLDVLTAYDPNELNDPASVERIDENSIRIMTASALEHFAWVANGYIYDEPIAGVSFGDAEALEDKLAGALDIIRTEIYLTGEAYDLTQSVGVWGTVENEETSLVTNGGKGHPNFYGLGTGTFNPYIGGLYGNGSDLKVYLNCPEGSFIGLIGVASSNSGGIGATESTSVVRDLTVSGLIRGKNKVGIVGYHDNYAPSLLSYDRRSTIELTSITNFADIEGKFYVGGLLGGSNSSRESSGLREVRVELTDCHNYGSVSGTYRVGGVIGSLSTNVATAAAMNDVTNHGEISAEDYNDGHSYNLVTAEYNGSIGGIVGAVKDRIVVNGLVANYGNVTFTGTGRYTGGIVGDMQLGFQMGENGALVNEGRVSGYDYTGGLIGRISGYHADCVYLPDGTVNRNTVSGNQYVGGLIGGISYGSGAVSIKGNFANEADVRGTMYVGGLIGYTYITNADNGSLTVEGNLTNSGSIVLQGVSEVTQAGNAGGLFGYVYVKKDVLFSGDLINTGAVKATTIYAGTTGNILNTATDINTGGLIGYLYAVNAEGTTITFDGNLSNSAPVSGLGISEYRNIAQRVGGLIGYIYTVSGTTYGKVIVNGSMENTANVEGGYYVGGIFGTFSASLEVNGKITNAEGKTVKGIYHVGGIGANFTGPSLVAGGIVNSMDVLATGHGYAGGLFSNIEYSAADGVTTELLIDFGESENRGRVSAPNYYNEYTTATNQFIGGLAGRIASSQYDIRIRGSFVNAGDVTAAAQHIGGMIGYVSASKSLGGSPAQYEQKFLIFDGTFTNEGKISGTSEYANSSNIGGLVGYMSGSVEVPETSSLENRGDITGTGTTFGGLFGAITYSNSDLDVIADGNLTNRGAVGGENAATVGGIFGTIYANGNLNYIKTVSLSGKGALVNEGAISAVNTVGGIFGTIYRNSTGSVSVVFEGRAENSGSVTAKGSTAGGIGGNVSGTNSTANLKETGSLTLGGTWTNSGNVSGAGNYVAGNIGQISWSASAATLTGGGTVKISGRWTNTGDVKNVGSYTAGNIGYVVATSPAAGCVVLDTAEIELLNEGAIETFGTSGGNVGQINWSIANVKTVTGKALTVSGSWQNFGRIDATGSTVGGNLGALTANCAVEDAISFAFDANASLYNEGSVTASSYVSGNVGRVYTASNAKSNIMTVDGRLENAGNVTKLAGSSYTGGVFGSVGYSAAIKTSVTISANGALLNSGKITGQQHTGGIIGILYGDLTVDGRVENAGEIIGTTDTAGIAGYFEGAFACSAQNAAVFSRGSVYGSAATSKNVGLYFGNTAKATVDEAFYGCFAAELTLGLGAKDESVSITADGKVYTTDVSGIFRDADGAALTVAMGGYECNQFKKGNETAFEKTLDYAYEESPATFVAAGFAEGTYPLVQNVKIIKGVDVVGSSLYVEGDETAWKFTVTTVYYDGSVAEGSASVELNLRDTIAIEAGKYVYHYEESVTVDGAAVPVSLTLYYVPQAVGDYLTTYKTLWDAAAVASNTVLTTADANYVARYEKGLAALAAFEAIEAPLADEDEDFLNAYLGNNYETANAIGMSAAKQDLYALTDATPDLSKGMSDGQSDYLTGYELLELPESVRYGDTTAGTYQAVFALYTLTNSGEVELSAMGVVPERTTEGYYRVAMPLTIRFSGEYEDIANVQFSRTFTLYSGSKVTFCLYNSLILTTDAYSYLAQEFEGIPVEKETIELKLGLNTSYQTYVTFKAGTEYSVYLSQARGSFKTSVKGEIPTNANAAGDTWNQLFQISVDGGATWLAGTNNYSSLFKWNTSGSYPVLIRLNRAAPEGEELPARLVNYEVSVNGIALNEANGYQTEIELTVAAQTAALVWSPVGGETVANATFAYTGTAQGFKAIFSSTDFSYEIRYYMTDASGKRIEGNTAIVPGTYTITAYAVADDGSEIPLSQLNLTNRTVTMTIIARDMVGESPTIEGIEDVVYDGNSHTPEFTVTWNGMELDLGNDYTFEVVDALNAGTASVIIRFMGNYTGTITREFEVTARNLEKEALVAQVDDVTYTGTAFEPQPAVTWNGKTLILGSDYTLSYEGNRNAGTASVTVTFIGNFTGSIVREFEIAKADYENISHDAVEAVYRPGIRLGDLTLEDGFRWADPDALIYAGEGEYQAIYNADPDNYNDFTLTIAVNVEQADSSFEIEYTRPDVIYMGGALPNLSLKEGGTAGTIAWDPYTLKPGTADYGWTFTPDDENYRTVRGTYSFTVSEKVIERIEVSFAPQQEIAYGVTYDDLRKGLTVTAFYSDGSSRSVDAAYCELNGSLNAGSNTITVVYSGKSAAFEITVEKAVPTVIPVYDTPDVIYTSGSLPELTLGEGSVSGTIDWDSYTLEAGTFEFGWTFTPDDLDNYEILKGSVSFTITPVLLISIEAEYTGAPAFVYGISLDDVRGAITVTAYYNDGTSEIVTDYQVNTGLSEDIFPAGNHSFEIAFGDQTDTLNVEIAAREIADVAEISGDEDQIYTGAQVKPELTVALEGAGLVSGRDYQVAYGENLNVGKGTATVTFIGNYSGTVKIEFAIAARDLSGEAQVGIPVWAIFTGDAIRPVPEVTWKGGALAAGRDYELSYGENIHAGEGSVTVTFLGNFTGKISRTFRIARAAAVGMTAEIPDQNFTQGGCRPAFDVYLGSTLLPQDEYTVEYFDNLEAGVAYALVTFVRDYVGTLVVPFRILETEQAALPVEEPVKSQPIRVPVQTKTAEQLPAFVLPQGGSGKDEEQIEWNPIG